MQVFSCSLETIYPLFPLFWFSLLSLLSRQICLFFVHLSYSTFSLNDACWTPRRGEPKSYQPSWQCSALAPDFAAVPWNPTRSRFYRPSRERGAAWDTCFWTYPQGCFTRGQLGSQWEPIGRWGGLKERVNTRIRRELRERIGMGNGWRKIKEALLLVLVCVWENQKRWWVRWRTFDFVVINV